MKTEKLSNLIGLYLLVSIGTMIAVGLLVIKPQYNSAEQTRLQVAAVDRKTADLRQLGADTEKLKANYESVKVDKTRILNLLPIATEEENLVVMVGNIAQKSGVILNNFTPENSGSNTKTVSALIRPLNVTFSVLGSFAAVQDFLTHMESSGRFMNFNSANYSAGSSQGAAKSATSVMQLQLNLTAFYQAPVGQAGVK